MLVPDAGFVSRRITQEARTLARLGATVDLFPTLEPLQALEPTQPGVRLLMPNAWEAPAGRAQALGRKLKALMRRRAGPVHRAIDSLQYALSDRAAQIAATHAPQLLAAGAYDVVFAHDLPVLPLGIRLKRAWGAALVVDLHEIFPEQRDILGSGQARAYWQRVESRGLSEADGLLAVNEAIDEYASGRFLVTSNRAVVHNAVPFVRRDELRGAPRIREIYGMTAGSRVAVFAGSLRLHGNLETLVLGFGEAKLDGWALALVGDGPARSRLEGLIAAHRLDDRVFIGYRASQDDLVGLLASAEFGIIPFLPYSRNLEMSTPAKLYEYIQARLPILTTRLPLVAGVVDECHTGGYFDGETIPSTAQGIRAFVSDTHPAISAADLDAAARAVCWQREEPALAAVVDVATAGVFDLAGALEREARS